MAKDVFYFKHDANASQDLAVKAMRKKYGWAGYGWWWYLIETLRNEDCYRLKYCAAIFDGLSIDMGCDETVVQEFIDYCIDRGLLQKDGEYFCSPRLNRDMQAMDESREQRREAGKSSARKRRDSSDNSTDGQRPFNGRSTIREEKIKEEESIEEEKREDYVPPVVPPGGGTSSQEEGDEEKDDGGAGETWEKALEVLRPQVSKPNFRTWFETAKGVSYEDGVFVVGAPNSSAMEYMSKNQRSLIERALVEVTGEPVRVGFTVANGARPP